MCAFYGYQVAAPGRPLLFQGQEFGQGREWNCHQSLDWHEGDEPVRRGLCMWLSDLLATYRHHRPLHAGDDQVEQRQYPAGAMSFQWLENNCGACVLAFVRHWKADRPMMCIFNFGRALGSLEGRRGVWEGFWLVIREYGHIVGVS